jgi:hypothetical protein
MSLLRRVQWFLRDTHGAITVDWVVLAAAIIGLSLGIVGAVIATTGDVLVEIEGDMGQASGILNEGASGTAPPPQNN